MSRPPARRRRVVGHTVEEGLTRPATDMRGQRFGTLLVIERLPGDGRHAYWRCRCDCGRETRTRADVLRAGRAQSCGCGPRQYSDETKQRLSAQFKRDLINRRFGRLLVIATAPRRGQVNRWVCACDCGAACTVDGRHLASGAQVSCGCFGRTAALTHGLSHTAGYKAASKAKRRARRLCAGGTYTETQVRALYRLQGGKCKYCQIELTYKQIHRDHRMPLALGGSNDIANIQILCAACNLSKGAQHPDKYERGICAGARINLVLT